VGPCLEITKDGETLRVWRDESPDDPRRDADYLGTMACYHRRYDLGDPNPPDPSDLRAMVKKGHVIALPLYLMDHSGLWMSTTADQFRAVDPMGWDWGQVGYIFVTRQKVREDFCVKRISPQLRDLVERMLQAEVREYNDYLQGDVYGYTVEDDEGRTLDSCWGFIGRPEDSGILDYIPEKFREEVADA
jgi:hypothetical protein